MSIRLQLAVVASLAGGACAAPPPAADPGPSSEEILAHARRRDFFTLRDAIQGHEADSTPILRFARGMVAHAFNRLEESNTQIEAARRAGGLSDSLTFALGAVEVTNYLRLFRYREGLAVADSLLAAPPGGVDSAAVADVANLRLILRALAAVPPQTVVRLEAATIRLSEGHIPVRIQDANRNYIFDTGANLSTMTRSEAGSLGLRIIAAGIDVGSSTDVRNRADLAVADRLIVGGLELRHVVFLVFDDRLLTFPGVAIRGIIGFPVIEAMGEVALRPSGEIVMPGRSTASPLGNLALDGHTPLTTIRWRGDQLLCRLDTGANESDFYEPLYRRHRAWIDSAGVADTATSGGVGGLRRLPVRRLTGVAIEVGDTTFTYSETGVLTTPITKNDGDNFLDCNLGHDVFDAFREYVIDFRAMTFALR